MTRLASVGLFPAPDHADWLDLGVIKPLYNALRTGRKQWICPGGRKSGFLRTEAIYPINDSIWVGFCLAAQKAAIEVGFSNKIANQLAAALGEMHSNLYEHSGAAETGIIVFHSRPKHFEFAVSDRGIGVLGSLKTNPEYADVCDAGEALKLILTEGVSRFGVSAKRGFGFRPIFTGLANLNGLLRFRSGDHALIIDGQSPSLMTARVAQKPDLQGFLISVSCSAI